MLKRIIATTATAAALLAGVAVSSSSASAVTTSCTTTKVGAITERLCNNSKQSVRITLTVNGVKDTVTITRTTKGYKATHTHRDGARTTTTTRTVKATRACAQEDSVNCTWDAAKRGNRQGSSFTAVSAFGVVGVFYADGGTVAQGDDLYADGWFDGTAEVQPKRVNSVSYMWGYSIGYVDAQADQGA